MEVISLIKFPFNTIVTIVKVTGGEKIIKRRS